MRISGVVSWLVILAVYVVIGIPIISTILLPMAVDWVVSNQQLLTINYVTTTYKIDPQTGQLVSETQGVQLSLAPTVLFLIQLMAYIGVPLILIFGAIRSR